MVGRSDSIAASRAVAADSTATPEQPERPLTVQGSDALAVESSYPTRDDALGVSPLEGETPKNAPRLGVELCSTALSFLFRLP
jgi:hypothetical protein